MKLSYGNIISMLPKKHKGLSEIIEEIKNKKNNKISTPNRFLNIISRKFMGNIHNMDKKFIIDDSCTCCGICTQLCPVKNIELNDKKPTYNHNCEACSACIQYCPQKAIKGYNIMNTTNENIEYKELIAGNKL
jgi:MinD superfamily P-loop ATPase